MQKVWLFAGTAIVIGAAFSLIFFVRPARKPAVSSVESAMSTEAWLCNGDGKICPDGSLLGRTGPNCQFPACPSPDATSATLMTYMGGSATGLNFTVNPRELVSDSRCPEGVECVWAGTVEVRTAVATKVGHGEHVFKLGEPRVVGDFTVTLVGVTPAPKAGEEIPISSYRFTYTVEKR